MRREIAGTAAKKSAASSIGMSSTSAIVLPLKCTSSVSRLYRAPWQTPARDVDVRKEVHLDLDRSVARARASQRPPLTLKLNLARLVPADLGLCRRREELADVVEHSGVRRGVGPRRATDGALVDVHDLVEVLEPGDGLVGRPGTCRAPLSLFASTL